MSEQQVVTVRGLRKSYGTRMVVDGLDLDVPAGEIVGLLGANGAGKTTTVECIQGVRKPDDGRQRMFLVLALLNRPRLVILDELTQGLDPAARRDVWAAIRQLNDEGTTVLLVTHEMDEAEALCNRVVVMREGRVLDAGAPADLVERHASTAVIRFSMPDPPAQLLDQVRRLDGVREVARSGARITVRGHRRIVAHVCAALVRWEPVPADLAISQPGLEDA